MVRKELIDGVIPSAEKMFDVIVHSHKNMVWSAWRLLKEAALSSSADELTYEERRFVTKRVTEFLEELASQYVLYRRAEIQGTVWGKLVGYDYVCLSGQEIEQAKHRRGLALE